MLGAMKRRDLLISLATLHIPGAGIAWAAAPGLHFPADFGAHPGSRTEWWYLTGSLEAQQRVWGFQVTFFRSRTDVPAGHPSRFAAGQLLFAHAALSDLAAGRQRHDQRIARAGFGLAEAAEGDTALRLRDWSLQRSTAAGRSVYATRVGSEPAGFALDLTLSATQPVLLQGEAGLSHKGGDATSRYYTEPQLLAGGTLSLDGRALAVRGKAWLDHEWSDQLLPDEAAGWDWIGMNLDDGSALTAFRIRRPDGSSFHAGGSFRPTAGSVRNFGASEVRFVPGRVWTSPVSGAAYPVSWSIETPAGRFSVSALMDAQELDSRASTGAFYWEGLSELADERGQRVGRGYLEMTGYASRLAV